jgi:hypothetical protein
MAEGCASLGRSRVGNTAARVEEALAVKVDKSATKDRVIPITEDGDRRTFLHPEQIHHFDAGYSESGIDAFCLFRTEAGGLENDDARGHVSMK